MALARRKRRRPDSEWSPPSVPPHGDELKLRLAVSRGLLAIELDAPFRLGPVALRELTVAFEDVKFPVDLSGGVARFRHRRGRLAGIALEAHPVDLAAWAAPRLKGLLGDATPRVVIVPTEQGMLVGVASGERALAFDVVLVPRGGDVWLVPLGARALGVRASPHALALRALGAVARPIGRLERGAVVAKDPAGALARAVLPRAGARAPSTRGLSWQAPVAEPDRIELAGATDLPPPALGDATASALELATLAADADDALGAGDLAEARSRYLAALERAPRHPEIARRLAWLDWAIGDRSEAALATLIEATTAVDAGVLGAELLEAVGDREGAWAALVRAGRTEPFGPLAALAWLRAASMATSLDERLGAVDEAVARSPGLSGARWARVRLRLDLGDVRGARADAEHLEAASYGASARHEVWRRFGDELSSRGLVAEAKSAFERALRYAPEGHEALIGLARSLEAAGRGRRAIELLSRAVEVAERRNVPAASAVLHLARALAEIAGDRPAAIARVRTVAPGTPEAYEARLLEGRWRIEIGDLAGAAIALGRLADACEAAAPTADPELAARLAVHLSEAAGLEERERGDVLAARRHLAVAVRLRPRDRTLAAELRRLAGGPTATAIEAPPVTANVPASTIETERPPMPEPAAEDDESVVERLTERVRANPNDDATVLQLADALARLGRDLELYALLSARWEEGTESLRVHLAPRRRLVLERLAAQARAEGRPSEAELYEAMLSG